MSAAQLFFDIFGRDKGVGKVFEEVSKKATGFGSTLGGSALKAGAAIGGIGVAMTGVIAGIAAKGGIDRALAIENAQAKLLGLGNSADTVKAIMGNALASVKGTAFGLGDAATVAASAVAAGIKPGAQLEGVLKTVADTATIAGASMSDMGLIFGSVAARGKLQGDDLMQLQARGVPVLAFLAKHYGITAAAASDMVQSGKVDFANFNAAMQENLGGAALKSGDTFQGAMANIRAALGRIGANFATPFLKAATAVSPSVIAMLDKIGTAAAPIVTQLAALVSANIPKITAFFDGLTAKLAALGARGIDLSWLEKLGPLIAPLSGALLPLLGKLPLIGAAFAGISGPAGIVASVFFVLLERSPLLKDVLGKLFDGVAAVLPSVVEGFTGFMGALDKVPGLVNALGAGVGVFIALSAAIAAINVATGIWNALMAVNPVTWVILGIAALVAAIVLLVANWDTVVRFLSDVWGGFVGWLRDITGSVGAWFADVWNSVAGAVSGAWNGIVTAVTDAMAWLWSTIVAGFTAEWNFIVGIVQAIVQPIVDAWNWVYSLVSDILRSFWAVHGEQLTAIWNTVTSVFAGIWSTITGVWNGIVSAVSGAVSWLWQVVSAGFTAEWNFISGILTTVWGFVSGVWNGIAAAVSGAVGAVWNTVVAGFSAAWGFISGVFNQVAGFIGSVWGTIAGTVSGAVGQVVGVFTGMWNRITGIFNGAVGWFADIGRNMIQSLIDGAGGLLRNIGQFFLNMVPGWIVEPFKRALGIASPSKVFRGFGKNIGEGLILGISDTASAIDDRMSTLVGPPSAPSGFSSYASADPQLGEKLDALLELLRTQRPVQVNPAPGMSEENLGRMTAEQLMWRS
ncbi:tape measure protein [Sinomonas sp. JGH33]|uniref:Tape measure protein n=1 Tax=Sinomonas terricola TaxID=3110330 RepID=A0ABU5T483_9MICC|nr:tape measure protein [Sinomonas sp. JGH33]MEA5454470.1 tape measure protein [Sinomonas sp. JGH33]